MAVINLRKHYPFYRQDHLIEVSDEVARQLQVWERSEGEDGRGPASERVPSHWPEEAEHEDDAISLDGLYEQKRMIELLYAALFTLPEKQAERIYANFFLGISQAEIAKREGVSRCAVNSSIFRGLTQLASLLREHL